MRGAPGQCHAWTRHGRHFGGFSWWHPSARTGRVQPAARGRCDRNSRRPDCLQGRRHSTLRCGLCGRGHLPYPGGAPGCCKNTQSPRITPSLPLGQAPHAIRRPPCRAAASRFHTPVFHATFVPHAIPRPPHTWAASPYGIAVSPYNHTPDAFPHMFWQIPIGRTFFHSHVRSPITKQSPHTIYKLFKPVFLSTRPAFGLHKSPTNPVKQTPWTCVTVQQTNPQPVQANNMVTVYTNQAPASSSKCYRPATGGCRHLLHVRHGHLRARPWSHLHGYVHTFMRMVTYAHPHGHARAFTAMVTSLRLDPHASGHAFDETSADGLSGSTLQSNPLKFTAPARGAWAWRRGVNGDCGVDDDRGSLNLHVMVRPEGRTDSSPEGGLCIGAACPLTLLFTTATSDV